MITLVGLIAAVLYIGATATYFLTINTPNKRLTHTAMLLSGVAVLLHTYSLYAHIETEMGQNLNFFNMLSMAMWLAVIVLWANQFKQNNQALLLISLPATACIIAGELIIKPSPVIVAQVSLTLLVHIFASLIAYSLLALACVQAIILWVLDRKLRRDPGHLSPLFPPLQAVETYLFQLLWLGFICLSISIGIALTGLSDYFSSMALHKPILTGLSWIVFAVLLFGRYILGWRGKLAVKYTLAGFSLLMFGYFGTKFVLEFLLG